jgi:Beta propeller domain
LALLSHLTVATALALTALSATAAAAAEATLAPKRTLAHFESEEELKVWLEKLRKRFQEQQRLQTTRVQSAPAMASLASPAPAEPKSDAYADESVTNVQTAGVDEGGIVKVHGDHLVVLRRGRLFTLSIANGGLASASMTNAYGPGIDPGGAWYDEMLIRGDTVIVIGFSYTRGGTEVGLFDIDAAGGLVHRATYHLRSNDYYSSRNYASRLIGDKLIFYTPLYLNLSRGGSPFEAFPAMRRWRGDGPPGEFKRIAPATRIYRTDDPIDPWSATLHTVTVCDIARREMECEATAVLGPAGRVFYVAKESVYVWTSRTRRGTMMSEGSGVFRIPLDGAAPSALKTMGSPIDQMSFLESDDGHLNVLVRAYGKGEAMWGGEYGSGPMALMRVPLDLFGDGRDAAPTSAYRRVPAPAGYDVQNRFVGPWVLYGSGSTWGGPNPSGRNALHALRWAENGTVQSLSIPHGVDRIEAMGRNAIVIGTAGKDLHFSSVRLGEDASIPYRFTRADAAQGETRSHGFFYKPESGETGIVGLPVVGPGRPGTRQLKEGSAAVAFLRNDTLMLSELGELAARPLDTANDNCQASCVDWYGNARPLFLRSRVFALMGYEIVEGRISAGAIEETRRVSFAPRLH